MCKMLVFSDKAKITQKLRFFTLNAHQNKPKPKQNTTLKCLLLYPSHQYPLAPHVLQIFLPAAIAEGHALFMHCAYLEKARSLPCSSLWATHKSAGLHKEPWQKPCRGSSQDGLLQIITQGCAGNAAAGKATSGASSFTQLCYLRAAVAQDVQAPGQCIIRGQQSSQSHCNPPLPGLHLLYFASYTTQNPTHGLLNTWK